MTLVSVDPFMDRRYKRGTYDCVNFTRDVWMAATGEDLQEKLFSLLNGGAQRRVTRAHRRAFRRLRTPESPAIAVMGRPGATPHMGVFIRGRILHLWERGVEFLPPEVASRGFTTVRYYQ